MVGQLTKNERQIALIILLVLAVCGLAMAVAGRDDPLGGHGALVILAAIAGIYFVIAGYYLPEPTEERQYHYYDDPTKAGIVLAMGWGRVRPHMMVSPSSAELGRPRSKAGLSSLQAFPANLTSGGS